MICEWREWVSFDYSYILDKDRELRTTLFLLKWYWTLTKHLMKVSLEPEALC